jgi:DNA ligase-1
MRYSSLVKVYEALEATSKRLEKTHILAEFLKEIEKRAFANIILASEAECFRRGISALWLLEQAWQ